LSIAKTVFGPKDMRLLSVKVMPAEPSAPVYTTSRARTASPTCAFAFAPARSICTLPDATLMSPTSWANAGSATRVRAASRVVTRMEPPGKMQGKPGSIMPKRGEGCCEHDHYENGDVSVPARAVAQRPRFRRRLLRG